MDLVILVILVLIILIWFRNFTSFVYFLGIAEIFFRIMHFIGDNLGIAKVNNVINKYIPSSLFSILANYSNGLLYTILCWGLVICFIVLEINLVKYFFKRH